MLGVNLKCKLFMINTSIVQSQFMSASRNIHNINFHKNISFLFSHSWKIFLQMLSLNCCVSAYMCPVGLFSPFEWLRCTTHVDRGFESGNRSFFLIDVQLSAVLRIVTAYVIYRIKGLCSVFHASNAEYESTPCREGVIYTC